LIKTADQEAAQRETVEARDDSTQQRKNPSVTSLCGRESADQINANNASGTMAIVAARAATAAKRPP
jgi:hypothetical protein